MPGRAQAACGGPWVGVCVSERCCRLVSPCTLPLAQRFPEGRRQRAASRAVNPASHPGFAAVSCALAVAYMLPPMGRDGLSAV